LCPIRHGSVLCNRVGQLEDNPVHYTLLLHYRLFYVQIIFQGFYTLDALGDFARFIDGLL